MIRHLSQLTNLPITSHKFYRKNWTFDRAFNTADRPDNENRPQLKVFYYYFLIYQSNFWSNLSFFFRTVWMIAYIRSMRRSERRRKTWTTTSNKWDKIQQISFQTTPITLQKSLAPTKLTQKQQALPKKIQFIQIVQVRVQLSWSPTHPQRFLMWTAFMLRK